MTRVRSATEEDALRISDLMRQLGYDAPIELVRQKLVTFSESLSDAVLVAEIDGEVAGVISLHILELFHAPGKLGRITALVMDADHRGTGTGKLLVRAADEFFVRSGCVRAEVTSGDHRADAHAFYQSQGYLLGNRRFRKQYDLTVVGADAQKAARGST